jgi:hypothetical protein
MNLTTPATAKFSGRVAREAMEEDYGSARHTLPHHSHVETAKHANAREIRGFTSSYQDDCPIPPPPLLLGHCPPPSGLEKLAR